MLHKSAKNLIPLAFLTPREPVFRDKWDILLAVRLEESGLEGDSTQQDTGPVILPQTTGPRSGGTEFE